MDDSRQAPSPFDPASSTPDAEPPLELTEGGPEPAPELFRDGPLDPQATRAILDRAAELLQQGDFRDAGVHYRHLVGVDDTSTRAAALLGLAESLYRLDQDDAAVATWEAIFELPETPSTYQAWRNVAAARVREGDLSGAIAAYREADRRAPASDKPEIANRLGWLAKETGNVGASRRYFARGRESGPALPLTWIIIGATVVVSFMAESVDGRFVLDALMLDKPAVAQGEIWRLWTVTLVHGGILHLGFNMFALYVIGPVIERIYGSGMFALFYLLSAAGGSVASFAFGSDIPSVGASGAVFGLFGVLLAAARAHHPVLDQQGRSLVGRVGMLIAINLILGFSMRNIDNAGHVGGLLAGLWLGFLIPPGRVTTLRSLWRMPAEPGEAPRTSTRLVPILGVAALVAVIAIGLVWGTTVRRPGVAFGPQPAAAAALTAEAGTPH
jgi:membrane associated rhomboid family serine protease